MVLAALSAQDWTAIGTIATTVILATTLGFVGWQVLEARKLRREQFRPWVVVSFHFRSIIAFASIQNVGRTAARNVRIRFDPPIASTLDLVDGEVAMLREPIPQLAPGEERLLLLDRVPDRLKSALPRSHDVHVEYADHNNRRLPADAFVLDFNLLDGARLPDKGMNDLVEEVPKAPRGTDQDRKRPSGQLHCARVVPKNGCQVAGLS